MKIKNIMKWAMLIIGSIALISGGIYLATTRTEVVGAGVPSLNAGEGGIPATDVVDVASYQGNLSVADFKNMRAKGVKGAIVKLTEGTGYKNPYAATQIKNARSAGLIIGAYHYSTFKNTATAQAEANYFATQAISLGLNSSTFMVDDLEDSSTKSGNVQNNAMAFANQLKSRGFGRVGLYTGPAYANSVGMNLSAFGANNVWIASYPYTPKNSDLWYTEYGMWQFNSNTHFPGVSGGFDVSVDYKGVMGGTYISNTQSVLKYATIDKTRYSGAGDGIYAVAPYGVNGNKKIGDTGKVSEKYALITEKNTTTDTYNKNKQLNFASFLASTNANERVYIDWDGFTNGHDVTKYSKWVIFNGRNSGGDGIFINSPHGFYGNSYVNSVKTAGLVGKYADVQYKLTIDGVTWYGAKINGTLSWFDSRAVQNDTATKKTVNYTAEINQTGRNDSIYANYPKEYTDQWYKAAKDWNGQVVHVIQEWTTPDGVTWIGFTYDSKTYYLDKNAVKYLAAIKSMSGNYMLTGLTKSDNFYNDEPYGFVNQHLATAAVSHNHKIYPILKSMQGRGGTVWYQLNVGGKHYWIDAKRTKLDNSVKLNVDYTATLVNQKTRKDGLFINYPKEYSPKYYKAATDLNNHQVEVTHEWTTPDGIKWLRFKLDGKTVYMDARGIKKIANVSVKATNTNVIVDQSAKRDDGLFQTGPINFVNAKKYKSAKQVMNGAKVSVKKEVIGRNNVHWYEIVYNNQTYWLDKRGTQPTSVKRSVDYTAKIVQTSRNDGLYKDKPWEFNAKWLQGGKPLNGKDIEVTIEWRTADGVTWVGFKLNGITTYMDKRGVRPIKNAETLNRKVMFKQDNRKDGYFYTSPNNFVNHNYRGQIPKSYNHKIVTVTKALWDSKGNRWYAVKINGNTAWVHDLAFVTDNTSAKVVNYKAQIVQTTRDDGIYLNQPMEYGTSKVRSAKGLNNQTITVTAEWTTPDNVAWVRFILNGQTVWMDRAGIKSM